MARWPILTLAALAVLIAGLLVALLIGSRRQQADLTSRLDSLRRAGAAASVRPHAAEWMHDTLPPPVSRYLRWALPAGTAIREVRIEQTGILRTDPRGDRWLSFEAEHIAVPPATGFVWNARVRMAPLLHVRVHDTLVDGRGASQVSLLSAFPFGGSSDTPEMTSGSLHRYLAEAVWYPTALLPGPTLQWSAIDAASATATLTHGSVSVSLEFRFADTGEVTSIYTPARWGTFDAGFRQAPWEGRFRDYRERQGVRVPTEGEVGWYVDDQLRIVWKGTITGFRLNGNH